MNAVTAVDVSIIIPNYNGDVYLESIIDTIKPYYDKGFEIILVDDGSSDTDKTVSTFKTLFPKSIIAEQKNQGLATARNKGASLASGEYLQFIDIDDSITETKISAQYKFAKRNQIDVVYSDWRMIIVDNDGVEKPSIWNTSGHHKQILEVLIDGWWNPFHSYLIKKEAYLSVNGSNTKLVNAQDFDLMVRLALHNYKFAYLPGHFSNYYRYASISSLARGNRRQYWLDYETSVLNVYESIKEEDRSGSIKDATCNRLFHIARNVYKIDTSWNKNIMSRILAINPEFRPKKESAKFKWLFTLFGYEKAEKFLSFIK